MNLKLGFSEFVLKSGSKEFCSSQSTWVLLINIMIKKVFTHFSQFLFSH